MIFERYFDCVAADARLAPGSPRLNRYVLYFPVIFTDCHVHSRLEINIVYDLVLSVRGGSRIAETRLNIVIKLVLREPCRL